MDENTLYLCKIHGFCRVLMTIIIFTILCALCLIIPGLGIFLAGIMGFVFLIVLLLVIVDNSSNAKKIQKALDEQNNYRE